MTNDRTPILSGTATVGPGDVLTVEVGGITYLAGDGNLTDNGDGTWELRIPHSQVLDEGVFDVVATLTDAAGNSSVDSGVGELEIDLTPPSFPTVDDLITNDTTPTLTGTAVLGFGDTLMVEVGGVVYQIGDGHLVDNGDGTWTLTIPDSNPLLEGDHEVVATVTDEAGNSTSDISVGEITIDLTPPVVPGVHPLETNDTTPTITGTAVLEPGDILTVEVDGIVYTAGDGDLQDNGDGTWTLTIPVGSELSEGAIDIIAKVVDLAGNESIDSSSGELLVDTTAPSEPTVDAVLSNSSTPVIQGTANLEAGEELTVTLNGITYAVGPYLTITPDGTWTLEVPLANSLPDGLYEVTAQTEDIAGNTTVDTSSSELLVDISKSPVAQDDEMSSTEDAAVVGNVLVDNGLGSDRDPNIGQVVFVARVNGDPALVGTAVVGSHGGEFTIGQDGELVFDPVADFDYLAANQTVTTSITYTIDDGTGLQDTATVTMVVTGVNDSPTALGSVSDQLTPSGSSVTPFDVSRYFDDVDGTTFVFDAGGTLPDGLSIDPDTGVIRGTITPGPDNLGVHEVVITATDREGGEVHQVFEWTVSKSTPVASGDTILTTENSVVSVPAISGLLANDVDFDGDELSVSLVNGVPIMSGQEIELPSGAQLVLNADGSFEYDPNGQFEGLVLGQSDSDTFIYTVMDTDGNMSSAVVNFNVAGENDAPVANDDWWVIDDSSELADGAGVLTNDTDRDSDSTLTVVEVNGEDQIGTEIMLPSGARLTLNSDGTYLYDASAIESAKSGEPTVDSFTYTIVDNHGLRSTATVTVRIQQQFAFDAFTNQALDAATAALRPRVDSVGSDPFRISTEIEAFVPEPVLSGYSQPGSVLVGRIYDSFGNLIGESTSRVSAAGNWVMNFYGINGEPSMRVVVEVVAHESELSGGEHYFRLTESTYRALQLGADYRPVDTAGSILADAPYHWFEEAHRQNTNPLGLL